MAYSYDDWPNKPALLESNQIIQARQELRYLKTKSLFRERARGPQ